MLFINKCKYQSKKSVTKLLMLSAFPCAFPSMTSSAATSLMVSGHAGFVGEWSKNNPPNALSFSALRVPIGLTLEARPTDNFSLFLGFEYAYNNYPGPSVFLGQTTATSSNNSNSNSNSNANGLNYPLPFANTVGASSPYSQRIDSIFISQAYFSYQTSLGLIRAGRMPRHWGLGIWKNAEWTPFSGLPSTSDAVAFTADFNSFDINLYYEKYAESVGGTSIDAEANAYTVEAKLKSDPSDVTSSGISQELGLLYTKFSHSKSNTDLNILDAYAKFYISNFYLGAELLYPTGTTQSPNYRSLGGAGDCNTSSPTGLTCNSQKISAFASLLKIKYQFDSDKFTSIAATEKSQNVLGTEERMISNVAGLMAGYVSGGSNQFESNIVSNSNDINAISLNSNIQPAILMFNSTTPAINGMPGGMLTNTTFVRIDYTYENPNYGSFSPAFIWGKINNLNNNYAASCNTSSPSMDSPINVMCVGNNKNLGFELDFSYRYTTLDRVTFGMDAAYWYVGKAWEVYNQALNTSSFALRASVATQF